MLSEREREFIRDYLQIAKDYEDNFRKKWSYDYERVIWHRIRKKYCPMLRDLMLLEEVLSLYERDELFYSYMIDQKTRGDEEEAQRLIAFWKKIKEINEYKKEGEDD
ncbi:MAG: hypothetical protein AYK18_06955 [Theionarchaea archaeon DG-70]|nr:MAG: hypothetical protein AYK18_06955 [Theionarchaea archaeon DG-70]